ncbi:MAG: hypothetical protein K9M75_10500 [Phycisphaerae bacterium]|nr:hypothetical protein [Phycisphaerae bacterium]
MQNQNEETKKTTYGKYLINTFAFLIVATLIYWLFIPKHVDKHLARIVICKTNLKHIAMSLKLYATDQEYWLPPHEKWNDLLTPYQKNNKILRCPNDKTEGDKVCTYVLNNNIIKLKPSTPSDLIIAFEGPTGWNQSGGPEMMVYRHIENTKCNVALADGTIKSVNEAEAKKLKWKP